ncbi:MAG TPA: ribonuclease P protein component [Polyangiaceae bacterium]
MRFGRDRRVRRRADFVRIQKTGRAVRTRHFVLLVAARESPGPSRLGIVAARTTGNAVARNRIKRLCRESFRLAPELVPAGVDLVVIAKAGAADLGLGDVQAEWAGAGARLRAECEKVLQPSPR